MNKIIIALTSFTLVSCVTPPRQYTFDRSIVVKDSYDNTWSRIVEFFARNNIQIKSIAKDSGIIAAEQSSFDSNVADCGQNTMVKPVQRVGSINVFVKTIKNEQHITFNTDFKIIAISNIDGQMINWKCNSTGALERALAIKAGRVEQN